MHASAHGAGRQGWLLMGPCRHVLCMFCTIWEGLWNVFLWTSHAQDNDAATMLSGPGHASPSPI